MKIHVLFVLKNYLKASRKGLLSFLSIFSIAGVFIGVSALILVIGIMTGFQQELRNRIIGMTPHIMAHKFFFAPFPENSNHITYIERIKGVKSCEPFLVTKTVLVRGENAEGVVLKGVKRLPDGVRIVSGDSIFKQDKVYLGLNIAASLGANSEDTLKIYSPTKIKKTPFGMVMSSAELPVGGVFDAGLYDYNTSFSFTHLKTLQELLEMGDSIAGYEVYLKDPFIAPSVQKEIEKKFGYPFTTTNWMELNRTVFQALKLEKLGMFLVLALTLIVASFGIISVLMLLITQKTREIGVLRAMGFTKRDIRNTFVALGLTFSLIGTAGGLITGVGLSYLSNKFGIFRLPPDVYFIDRVPIVVRPMDVFYIVGLTLVISFIASLIPSVRASKMEPVEAIRYE
ncbi:MAG: ABC transporter permease [bacterium]|nr:ABC transporter permease [bacterium]